jgi:ech hydrogenase subunit D
MEIKNPGNKLVEIETRELLGHVMAYKNKGYRLSQICCAYSEEKLHISYSLADDETNDYVNLRLVIDKETPVCSVTEFYPYAFLYENEMKELFGVNVQMISLDYQNKLYRINEEAPFIKK